MCAETCRTARTRSYGRHENYWSGLMYRRATLPPLLFAYNLNVWSTLNTVAQGVSFNFNHLAFNRLWEVWVMHHGFLKRNEICWTEVPDNAHGQRNGSNKGRARVRAFYSMLPYPSTPFTRCTPCSKLVHEDMPLLHIQTVMQISLHELQSLIVQTIKVLGGKYEPVVEFQRSRDD